MTTLANPLQQELHIQQQIQLITELNQQHVRQVMDYSKGFLDKTFPLARGSHKDVASYVVYYQQLLAFFQDGSTSGLKEPAQFIALIGHREAPEALLLQNEERHVELILNRRGLQGSQDPAGIDDIQLQTTTPDCHWFSLISGRQISCRSRAEKSFTAKDGQPFQL